MSRTAEAVRDLTFLVDVKAGREVSMSRTAEAVRDKCHTSSACGDSSLNEPDGRSRPGPALFKRFGWWIARLNEPDGRSRPGRVWLYNRKLNQMSQ